MAKTQNFTALFQGGTAAHGRTVLSCQEGKTEPGSKAEAKCSTIPGPATPADYEAHLTGGVGLGIVPIMADGYCRFGVIDVDEYGGDDGGSIRAAWKLGLRPFRSKSGGIHLYAFFSDPEGAGSVRALLGDIVQALGLPAGTERFPKQKEIAEGGTGSWINLPYYGDTRRMIKADGSEAPLEEALASCEAGRRGVAETRAMLSGLRFMDGPPCLQALALRGVEHGRNNFLFSAGLFFKAKGGGVEDELRSLNSELPSPLLASEVSAVAASAAGSPAKYRCTESPLCDFCNQKVCERRKYGINGPDRKTASFSFVRYGDIEITPPRWIVRGIIEEDALGAVVGDPASGKSFLALDLAASIASGKQWHGREIVRPGPALILAAEGRGGLSRRLRAWELDRGVKLKDAPIFISTSTAVLTEPEIMRKVGEAAGEIAEATGKPPSVVILDTWSRSLGEDENAAQATNAGFHALMNLRESWTTTGTGTSFIIVHHSGLGDKTRARGSSAFRAGLDFEYVLTRGSDDVLRFTCTKEKEGEPPTPQAFRFKHIDLGICDDLHQPVTSAVLETISYTEDKPGRKAGSGDLQHKAYAALQALGGKATAKAWRDACDEAGIPRAQLDRIKKDLIGAGLFGEDGAALFIEETPF
ncbi:MAG: hypothetical protein A2001_19265 [Treponema sp. GWC1_61_84]|nr:MAG: hypothetical protein A2001_19265 [Treponema sp. GWC1_61_84]